MTRSLLAISDKLSRLNGRIQALGAPEDRQEH